jgi:hypothetical protein
VLLGLAMLVGGSWLIYTARATTFSGDDIYYYASYIGHGYGTVVGHGVEYFISPHNGHLQLSGKIIYRVLFEIFGAHYWVFRLVNTIAILLAVGLFFVLAAKRVGYVVALAPAALLIVFGYAYEPLIWAFDMHTTFALAFGLAAVLALEREDRKGDLLCLLCLLLSVSFIELGVAFSVGVAVSVLMRSDRWRRCWIFLIPLVLYAVWWVWAQHFHQPSTIQLANVTLIPKVTGESLAVLAGTVTGVTPTGGNGTIQVIPITAAGWGIAAAAVALLVRYLVRVRGITWTFWVFSATVFAYWVTIALGDRAPAAGRYVYPSAFLILLAFADALRSARWGTVATVAVFVVAAIAVPRNVYNLWLGRQTQINDATATKVEVAMIDLGGGNIEAGFIPDNDHQVIRKQGRVAVSLPAIEYKRAGKEFGSLAESLEAVRAEPMKQRELADATLAGGYRLALAPAGPSSNCAPAGEKGTEVPAGEVRSGVVTFGSKSNAPVEVRVSRFAKEGQGIPVGTLQPGEWASVNIPRDSDEEPWQITVSGPAEICVP